MIIYTAEFLLEDRRHCVYKITNLINGKGYIGRTCDFDRRMKQHKKISRKIGIGGAINKYGIENFSYVILTSNITLKESLHLEKINIIQYDTFGENGYNLTSGGDGINDYKHTEETKQKISIMNGGENNYWYGITGEDHPLTGRKQSDEWILKRTGENNPMFGKFGELNPNFRRKCSEEQIVKQSGENHWCYGLPKEDHPLFEKTQTEEHIESRISKLRVIYLVTFPDNHTEIINNLLQFCKDHNLNRSCMAGIANGRKNPIHKGFKCEHYIPIVIY